MQLRRLERVGLISRQVISSSPVAVQYQRTTLGDTLEGPSVALLHWCQDHADEVLAAEKRFEHTQVPAEASPSRSGVSGHAVI